jgi:hypothetical protein
VWMIERKARQDGECQILDALLGDDHGLADDVLERLLDEMARTLAG